MAAEIDESLLDEEVVLLLKGRNSFNDRIFSYVQITLRNLQRLKEAIENRIEFIPSDFGAVLAAGKGEPSDELKTEMAQSYNLIEVKPSAAPPPAPAPVGFAQPSIWDADEGA